MVAGLVWLLLDLQLFSSCPTSSSRCNFQASGETSGRSTSADPHSHNSVKRASNQTNLSLQDNFTPYHLTRLQPYDLAHLQVVSSPLQDTKTAIMAPSNLPPIFNATSQDIEMLIAAQCHIGSKNLQVHMEPYLWKTRPDGLNVINIGKTWSAQSPSPTFFSPSPKPNQT